MEFITQKLIFIFVIWSAIRYCVNGENASCVCSGKLDNYFNKILDDNSTKYIADHNNNNLKKIIHRLDSLLKIQDLMLDRFDFLFKIENVSNTELQDNASGKKKNHTTTQKQKPHSCKEALGINHHSGIYFILAEKCGLDPTEVYCENDLFGGNWTVVARRTDGTVDFFRHWDEYKEGFGDLEGEFFIGLDKLYGLTNGEDEQELIIIMDDYEDERRYAKYSSFAIGDQEQHYALNKLGEYSGDAGDSLSYHLGATFKTRDTKGNNCATKYSGAWWYKKCYDSNLFGKYLEGISKKGLVWYTWHGSGYSVKSVLMMIRPNKL